MAPLQNTSSVRAPLSLVTDSLCYIKQNVFLFTLMSLCAHNCYRYVNLFGVGNMRKFCMRNGKGNNVWNNAAE